MLKVYSILTMLSALIVTVSANAAALLIPGGTFQMGSNNGMPHERPVHEVKVTSFKLDISPVSVGTFEVWLARSGYKTEADKFGNSAVFDMDTGQWNMVTDANWQYPMGPDQEKAQANHPVTQVSWHDAKQYCEAAGGRLPKEAEFEYAAKGAGQYGNPVYAFGDKIVKDGDFLVNVYNGKFPFKNTGADGYLYTAPIGKTGITPLGLTDMAGNVWEWTNDWYGPYTGTSDGTSAKTEKALRGGSFLCDQEVCHGYRTTGRTHSTPDSSLVHTGFRCAYDVTTPPTETTKTTKTTEGAAQ
ncbi:MAG: sulfatase modifying factor 1 [Candidatus Azotimanducaceae bacterium]|jgi:sulfatase modifying factor 1